MQKLYGQELAAEPYVDIRTPYRLRRALGQRRPPLDVTEGVCKQWFDKYRTPAGAVRVEKVDQLEAKYGAVVREVLSAGVGRRISCVEVSDSGSPQCISPTPPPRNG